MATTCELCNDAVSKYKCPACGLRYCSLACYKPHKIQHEEESVPVASPTEVAASFKPSRKTDRPGTTQRVAKQEFTDFEHDAEFARLMSRYPKLKTQLQGLFALTLDPGPQEQYTWNKGPLPMLNRDFTAVRQAARGRDGRGRGSKRGGLADMPEGRQRGPWTTSKGDQEALFVMRKVQDESTDEAMADGLEEFVELVRMRFGDQDRSNQNGMTQYC